MENPTGSRPRVTGPRRWPVIIIAAPAAVAVWTGWVALGGMCGFGLVQPLPGIVSWHLDTAITLPVGVEAYGAYALGAWLRPGTPDRARVFAFRSAIGALVYGVLGQVVFHLLAAAHAVRAPWPVVTLVACMPVVTLGFGVALTHLLFTPGTGQDAATTVENPVPGSARKSPTLAGGAGSDHPGPAHTPPAPVSPVPVTRTGLADPCPVPVPRAATRTGQDNRAAVLHLRALHPDWTKVQIATELGTHPKTVSRHLAHANGSST